MIGLRERAKSRARRRSEAVGYASDPADPRQAPRSVEEWAARLVDEGVSSEWAGKIAEQLAALAANPPPAGAAGAFGVSGTPEMTEMSELEVVSVIRGAAAAAQAQSEAHAHVERNMRDVREVERLLGAFSGELEKLDEVLEVLAAYAQRMRSKPSKRARPTLH